MAPKRWPAQSRKLPRHAPSVLATSPTSFGSSNLHAALNRRWFSAIRGSTNSPPIRYRCSNMTPSSLRPERNPMTPLQQKLNQLTLSTMSRQLETTLTDAAARNLSAAATLEWLADMEIEARSQRAIERRFRSSHLQAQPSIDAFHFQHHKSRVQAKPRLLRLLDLSFLATGTNIVLIGNPGVGKTFLAKVIAWRACQT